MKRTGGGQLGGLGLIVLCLALGLTTAQAQTGAQAPAPASTPQVPGGEDTYVVKRGDTLWGIARDLLKDPVLWPRIWETNPYITDPNRIYPGDTLALPGREMVPQAPTPVAEAPKPEPPKEVPKEEAKAPAPAPPAPPAVPEMILPLPPPVPVVSQQGLACSPVLLEESTASTAGVGSVLKTPDNRLMTSQEDEVIVGLDGAQNTKVGDRLAIIRPGTRVIHPWHKGVLGRGLYTLGVLDVTEVRDTALRARIIYGCAAIALGDRVAPFVLAAFPEDKIAQPTTRQVAGAIVDTPGMLQLIGLQSVVFLDVGTGQGIASGDVFAIYRTSLPVVNPVTGKEQPIPPDRLGEAVIIRVTSSTATAVISASGKEIRVGDSAVLSRQIQP